MGQISIPNTIYLLQQQTYAQVAALENHADGLDTGTYAKILDAVRSEISQKNADEFAGILSDEKAKAKLANLIENYLNQYIKDAKIVIPQSVSITDLGKRIYYDMAEFSVITPYLYDDSVEEININSYNTIQICSSEGKFLLEKGFAGPEECTAVIKKMMRTGNTILDAQHPIGDSDLGGGTGIRISALIPPAVDAYVGGNASIRKQKTTTITRESMITFGTATEKMFDMLSAFLNNLIPICFSGSTGSGKTANMGVVLQGIDDATRIYTIEDSRELQLARLDASGRLKNDVIMTQAVDTAGITLNDLLQKSLRFDPEIIVPSEIRTSEAALNAVEAANTGHGVITSIHANSAKEAYRRILTLCMKSKNNNLSSDMMLSEIVAAFPVVCFAKKLRDGSRKIMEMYEGEAVYYDTQTKTMEIKGRMLFQYEIDHYEKDADGKTVRVHGKHVQQNAISERLKQRLKGEGVPESVIAYYADIHDDGSDRYKKNNGKKEGEVVSCNTPVI